MGAARAWFRIKLQHRQRKRDRVVFDEALEELLEREAEQAASDYADTRRDLLRCLERMREPQRRLVLARYFEGKPVSEMARELGRTPNAISQALFRARLALVSCLEPAGADESGESGRTATMAGRPTTERRTLERLLLSDISCLLKQRDEQPTNETLLSS